MVCLARTVLCWIVPDAIGLPACPAVQRRGHQWEDTRHLLRQLEKEEAQRAIDGDEAEV